MSTRSLMRGGAAILIIVIVIPFAVFASRTNIYSYGGDFDLPIPAQQNSLGWMDDAVIEIPDCHIITDLDVKISVKHTSIFDLQIFLQSPSGTIVCLNKYSFVDEFFVGENYINTIFDDEAELNIKKAKSPFTGRFKPIKRYKLSAFDGEQAIGLWRLKINDRWHFDSGELESFELMITNPEPATVLLLILGLALVMAFRPHHTA
ncbi:MAG: proprotein convertase P-domain-containing protein [Planctomycetes bacterium]|nr:proprotein convertase P-domain-containing protein [Planctomycetota bacterium]